MCGILSKRDEKLIKHFIAFFILFTNLLFAQKLEFALKSDESDQTRKIVLLNKNWTYEANDETKNVSVPFWIDDDVVVLRKKIKLAETSASIYFLRFDGIRGLESIYFNDERIPFDPIELEEFSFRIPSNIVKENGENFLRLIISKKYRVKEQNVLAAKIELPERKFGVFKDIYLEILPPVALTQVNILSKLDNDLQTGKLFFKYEVSSFKHIQNEDAQNLSVKVEVRKKQTQEVVISFQDEFNFQGNLTVREGNIVIKNPELWDVNNPSSYNVKFQLFQRGDLVDQKTSQISFRKIEIVGSKLFLNNKPLTIRGVTYFESNGVKNSFFMAREYERDINLIKDLNVNSIFVKNSFPSKELMNLCERNGILVFFDVDSKTYPSKLTNQMLSDKRKKLDFIIDRYSNYGCFAGLNLGPLNQLIIADLTEHLKKKPRLNTLTFVETPEITSKELENLDFVAYNLLHKETREIENFISKLADEKFILISAVGYNHGIGEEEGYSNPYSIQAQAKYLSDVLKILTEKNISFFVHTFSDYRLPYHSIVSGKLDNQLMKYGLVNEYRDKKKLSYHTLKSYLNESKLPLIMQGDYNEKANVIFILTGLLFLALTIITINSTHRFRENVSRAVLKTYNFFSDIRDGWFISSFHSVLLALITALSSALTYSSLFYYWKDKIDFEKFISLFNSGLLFEFISYVAWRPIEATLYFTLLLLICMALLIITIKFFNLFVKNKIFINHAFLIVVWSAIPSLILIPLGMVTFKVLSLKKYDLLIYIIVALFHLWIFLRTLKGISIVFEVKKSKVYLVSFLFLISLLVILILYLQINFSSLDYFMDYFG